LTQCLTLTVFAQSSFWTAAVYWTSKTNYICNDDCPMAFTNFVPFSSLLNPGNEWHKFANSIWTWWKLGSKKYTNKPNNTQVKETGHMGGIKWQ